MAILKMAVAVSLVNPEYCLRYARHFFPHTVHMTWLADFLGPTRAKKHASSDAEFTLYLKQMPSSLVWEIVRPEMEVGPCIKAHLFVAIWCIPWLHFKMTAVSV